MKQRFKAVEVSSESKLWSEKTEDIRWLNHKVIDIANSKEHEIKTYIHESYISCEYKIKLDICSFGKLKIYLPFTVIAPPISVDESGFVGDINALISDYKARKGLFLMLNLKQEETQVVQNVAAGKTLATCIFNNDFKDFEHYMASLRSGYRRRIKMATKSGVNLKIQTIENKEFTEELYSLYLQVHSKSDFPLETLTLEFFRNCACKIDVFYWGDKPLAFVMHEIHQGKMAFIFGGMDYEKRDEFDLYYNMLIHLVKIGIDAGVKTINFGQTAEISKLRMGCEVQEKYMIAFSGNGILNSILKIFIPLLENKKKIQGYKVFASVKLEWEK